MNKSILIVCFALLSISAFSQKFQKAVIEMKDGNKKIGLLNGTIKKQANKIKFKSGENATTESISIDLIKSIDFQDSSGENYHIDNVHVYTNEKRSKSESILLVNLESGYYDLYLLADISFDKKGITQFSDTQYYTAEVSAVFYFIKNKKDEIGYFFATENLGGASPFPIFHKHLKKNMEQFMPDDKNLILKVENKKLSVKDVPQIVREYNEFKKVNGEE